MIATRIQLSLGDSEIFAHGEGYKLVPLFPCRDPRSVDAQVADRIRIRTLQERMAAREHENRILRECVEALEERWPYRALVWVIVALFGVVLALAWRIEAGVCS